MFSNVVCGLYSVVFCTMVALSYKVLRVAAFADVFFDLIDCVFVVSGILFVFTLSLSC